MLGFCALSLTFCGVCMCVYVLQLKKRGLLPTDRTYSSILSACGAAGPPAASTLDKIREEMDRRDVQPNTITTNALLSALSLCGRQEDATQIYLDMEKKHLEPDLYTFTGLLMTMSKDESRGMAAAQGVWSEIEKAGLKPDLHCFNMMLQVLRDGGLDDSMKGEELTPLKYDSRELKKRLVPLVSTDTLKRLVETVSKRNEDVQAAAEQLVTITQEMINGDGEEGILEEEEKMVRNTISSDWEDSDGENEEAEEHEIQRGSKKRSVVRVTGEKEGDKNGEVSVVKEGEKEMVLDWSSGEGAERSEVYIRGEVRFVLSEQHSLVLSVGSESSKDQRPPNLRWLEKNSIETLFAAMKQSRVRPDIHTFHMLAHLTLDPAHLLVTMEERKVVTDVKLMLAAVTQQAKKLHNLQGAWVGHCVW